MRFYALTLTNVRSYIEWLFRHRVAAERFWRAPFAKALLPPYAKISTPFVPSEVVCIHGGQCEVLNTSTKTFTAAHLLDMRGDMGPRYAPALPIGRPYMQPE